MRNDIKLRNAIVIPNGVNFHRFFPIAKDQAQKRLYFNPQKKHILFASNPDRPEKNDALADKAIRLVNNYDVEVHFLKNIINSEVKLHYCASDIVLLTSTREGSPNVIKEAMACNRPIVCTNVGDVRWVLGDTPGCYVASFESGNVAVKLKMALKFSIEKRMTNGRGRLMELGLDSESIASKIINIYHEILEQHK